MKRIFSIGAAVVFAAFGAFAGDGGASQGLAFFQPVIEEMGTVDVPDVRTDAGGYLRFSGRHPGKR